MNGLLLTLKILWLKHKVLGLRTTAVGRPTCLIYRLEIKDRDVCMQSGVQTAALVLEPRGADASARRGETEASPGVEAVWGFVLRESGDLPHSHSSPG